MDRTIIVPYRAEEKELSHILHSAIQGLTLLYPPSEDLKKCLSDEMFIKPNQQAFFHIMHYLFRLLDPQEFKKRFFWPITDKRSESNFRTSCVEYLKHINDKYHLNWTNIKSYLVVMPGGMKFISFLLDFVNFIVQELIKQKEKQLNLEASNFRSQVTEANLHKMCAKNEFFKGMASEFIDAVENLNTKYDNKTEKIMQHLEKLSQESGLSIDLLTDEKFLESFQNCNYQLYEKCYKDRSKNILEMDILISELKEAIDTFYSKETGYKYDKQRICLQLKRIRDCFPNSELKEESFESKVTDDGVNINTLIAAFNAINETVQNELKIVNKEPCVGELVYSRLLSQKKELQEMEDQITNFNKMLNENVNKCKNENIRTPINTNRQTKRNTENTLLLKLVSTPPIKFELPEAGGKSRLALVDSKIANTNEATFNNFLVPPRTSTVRQPNHHSLVDQTIYDLNNTMNRSKIIDPIQLLRSTSKKDSAKYKNNTTKSNISNLSTNWKLRQTILNDNSEEERTVLMDVSPSSKIFSPTPFSSNDHTKISRSQYQLDSGITAEDASCSSPLNYVKKLSAVQKVQDASLNFANLSTSPSGRLEPLVTAEDLDIPKLKLNDISIDEHDHKLDNYLVYEKPELLVGSGNNNIEANDEKYLESITDDKESANRNEPEEDALFNISDSVLKDVTF